MIDDENHPEMQRAMRELLVQVNGDRFVGRRLTTQFMVDLNDLIKHHRDRWRSRGVDFPVLAAMIVPRIHAVSLMRADLDPPAIASRIVRFAREHPAATAVEVAQAVRWAFPGYRPDPAFMERMRGQR